MLRRTVKTVNLQLVVVSNNSKVIQQQKGTMKKKEEILVCGACGLFTADAEAGSEDGVVGVCPRSPLVCHFARYFP